MKNITEKQVEAILQIVYSTNIPAQTFDSLSKLLSELPNATVTKEKNDKEK